MSTPCKFFLKGTCRFGDNCRFSHQTTSNDQYHTSNVFGGGGRQMSNFGNYSPQQNNYAQQAQQHRSKIDESLKVIEEAVKRDMIEWERGKIWPFSSYGPIGGKPNLPGFDDLSAEELRYATIQNNGQPPPEVAMRFSQWNGYRSSYQTPTPANRQLLHQISMAQAPQPTQATASPFQPSSPQVASSPFQSPTNTAAGGIFGGVPSFGGGVSPFGGGITNAQQTLPFMGMTPNNPPAFSTPTMNPISNPFGSPHLEQMEDAFGGGGGGRGGLPSFSFNQALSQTTTQQPSAFSQSPFGAPSTLAQNQSPFGVGGGTQQFQGLQTTQQPAFGTMPTSGFNQGGGASTFPTNNSIFGMQPTQSLNNNNNPGGMNAFVGGSGGGGDALEADFTVYSKDSDLTDNEVRAFENPTFDIETLPLQAPSKRFCC